MRGGLATLIALGLVVVLAGGWLLWGRDAWNRRQFRGLLRDAIRAHQEERSDEGNSLTSKALDLAERHGLRRGAEEKDLLDVLQGLQARRASEEPDPSERPARGIGSPWAPFRDLREQARRHRLPCPAVVEFLAALDR